MPDETIEIRTYEYHRRKAEQAYECAGLARRDGDKVDAARWTKTAQEHDRIAAELRG